MFPLHLASPSLFTHFTCCSCWPGSLMSRVSFRLLRKPWRSIAPCGTWIWNITRLVPRELRPGLFRMCRALWLRLKTHQGVSQVWWCFLWVDVACLISVLFLVMCPGLVCLTCFHSKHFQISFKWVSCRFVGWSRLVRGEPSLFTHFTCCSCWPVSLMSCVSFRLSQKPWRPIAPCGTWIWKITGLVPRKLRPGLYRMCWALWLRCSPYQGVSQVWWCFLWVDVACLISVLLLVMCPGLVSLTCFYSKHFQISFKWVSCRFVGWSRLVRGEPSLFTHFTCCSCWPGSLMSCVSLRLSQKPWRPIAPCGTWIWKITGLVPRELRPGLFRMSWALWLTLNPHQGVSQVLWCSLYG